MNVRVDSRSLVSWVTMLSYSVVLRPSLELPLTDWLTDWPVLEGCHKSSGEDSRGDTDWGIVVGRGGGEEAEPQVEADDDDSCPQWRHAAAPVNYRLSVLSLLQPAEDDNQCIFVCYVYWQWVTVVLPPPTSLSPLTSIFQLKWFFRSKSFMWI